MGTVPVPIDTFPGPVQRGDRARLPCTDDLNLLRAPGNDSITPRPGTRLLSIFEQQRPVTSDNPPTNTELDGTDTVHLIRRKGAQPLLAITTDDGCENGPAYGTVCLIPILLPTPSGAGDTDFLPVTDDGILMPAQNIFGDSRVGAPAGNFLYNQNPSTGALEVVN